MTAEHRPRSSDVWGPDAIALAIQARVLSGHKLDQLVRRLQRQTGRSREACWRFVLQTGLNSRDEHRRWTEEEIESLREQLASHSVEETASILGRSANAIRCKLRRHDLKVKEIRCDCFSVEALARTLRVRKSEIHAWIEAGWLEATTQLAGKRLTHIITPEAFRALYTHHLRDLLGAKEGSERRAVRGVLQLLLRTEAHHRNTTADRSQGQARAGSIRGNTGRRRI